MACLSVIYIFFFKQKTAYEMRISDWSSDVCSSDLKPTGGILNGAARGRKSDIPTYPARTPSLNYRRSTLRPHPERRYGLTLKVPGRIVPDRRSAVPAARFAQAYDRVTHLNLKRSEEHTSELQSLMRNSYACL